MGYGRQMFLMIITFFMAASLQSFFSFTSIIIVADAEELHEWSLFMEENGKNDQTHITKVAGEEENEQKEGMILEKFRALLGLKSFKPRKTTKDDSSSFLSPAPSPSPVVDPSEAPAPAPAPSGRVHSHSHHLSPRSPTHHKIHKEEKEQGNKVGRILLPLLVSAAAGIGFVACVVGVICFCGKIKKQSKKIGKTMSLKGKKGKKSQNSTRKVSINPTLDFLYLNSLGVDLEQQTSACLKQTHETLKTSPDHHSTLLESEVKDQETEITPESDNASSSSTREIVSVHEDEQIQSLRCGDNIVPLECNSSDDESFHSFCGSHSSNIRLSNASASSNHDSSELLTQNEVKLSPEIPLKETSQPSLVAASPLPPPPPPPPPPPLFSRNCVFPSHSFASSRSKITSKASSSSIPSSSLCLDSFSGPKPNIQTHLSALQEKASNSSQNLPSNNPAPPCPPPPPLIGNNKTPPPPPSRFPQFTPLGKDGAPLPKLKPLHWDKVRAAPDRNMVWDKLRTSSFEFDEEMIESLFGYTMQNSTKNDEAKSKMTSPSKHVLEPKRLQNITILLKALNATSEQVCTALVKGEGLCLQELEALVKMVPTKEEESKLSNYKGNIDELGSTEKFIKVMLGIPFAFLRAEAMLYRENFEDEVAHLRNSFSILEEACKELKSSRLFLKLLEAVLKTGNRMNVGTIRGGARAFKLDALLKLSDVKGTDGKTTLLHFVVQEISRSEGIRVSDSIMGRIMNKRNKTRTVEEKEEHYRIMGLELVSGLNTELYNVKKTATIDLDVLASSVSNLKEGMAKLRCLLRENLSKEEKDGGFVHSMNLFLNYAEKNLKELQEDEDKVLLRVREITEYFHGDVSKDEANPLRIFMIVRDFLGMLDHVCKELRCLNLPSSPNPLAPFR